MLTPEEYKQFPRSKPVIRTHFFFVVVVILTTSWNVYHINSQVLQHSRFFRRALHWHILQHQIDDVYWFGQEMLNYPWHQFYTVGDLSEFLLNMWRQMGSFDTLALGQIDQQHLNTTVQTISVLGKDGSIIQHYNWTILTGPTQPFTFKSINNLRKALTKAHWVAIQFQTIHVGQYQWDISMVLEPFSDVSVFVYFRTHQQVSLIAQHILPFLLGLCLGAYLVRQYMKGQFSHSEHFFYYFLCLFLLLSSSLALADFHNFQLIFILDGFACFAAWLCAIKFNTKKDDYKLSFLLTKSYIMILQLFASFLPLLFAFSLFGYTIFSRYSGQFSSLWRTFLSLFYICYYNMTYESAIVTSRSNPIALLFFITFVILFTICIYSGMLVSVFCAYVWGKREQQIKQHIVDNLKVHCAECDHVYRYRDRVQSGPRRSFVLGDYLAIDWSSHQQRKKYQRVMLKRIEKYRQKVEEVVQTDMEIYYNSKNDKKVGFCLKEELWLRVKHLERIQEQILMQ